MTQAYKVTFTKRFVGGSIAGIEYRDALHFATPRAAEDFAQHCQRHDSLPVKAIGGADYTCHDVTLERIELKYIDLED